MHTKFWSENQKGRDHWEDLSMDRRVWIGCIWLRIGTSGGLLWIWWWTFEFHKRQGTSRLAEWLLASQGLCSMESFNNFITVHVTNDIHVCNKTAFVSECTFFTHMHTYFHYLCYWVSDMMLSNTSSLMEAFTFHDNSRAYFNAIYFLTRVVWHPQRFLPFPAESLSISSRICKHSLQSSKWWGSTKGTECFWGYGRCSIIRHEIRKKV